MLENSLSSLSPFLIFLVSLTFSLVTSFTAFLFYTNPPLCVCTLHYVSSVYLQGSFISHLSPYLIYFCLMMLLSLLTPFVHSKLIPLLLPSPHGWVVSAKVWSSAVSDINYWWEILKLYQNMIYLVYFTHPGYIPRSKMYVFFLWNEVLLINNLFLAANCVIPIIYSVLPLLYDCPLPTDFHTIVIHK